MVTSLRSKLLKTYGYVDDATLCRILVVDAGWKKNTSNFRQQVDSFFWILPKKGHFQLVFCIMTENFDILHHN